MKFIFKIQEPATFFYFLDSVSLWDIHTRKWIREYYENKFSITKQDKKFIKKYIKIRKKYPWGILDSDFILAKNFDEVNKNLNKRLTKNEYVCVMEIINYFYPNIHKIYIEWKNRLEKRKNNLEKLSKKIKTEKIFSEIIKFYKSKHYPVVVYVHLLINPSESQSGGGANINPRKHITIETSKLDKETTENVKNSLSVIIHETLHLIESGIEKKEWKNFEKRVKKQKLNFNILTEAIADTLVPHGYLAQKYKLNKKTVFQYKELKIPNKKNKSEYYQKTRQKLSALIYPLTEKQMRGGKSVFDDDYIEKCIFEFKKMLKK
ncbi:MAG: hypothetical protein WC849_02655 [Candidatus Paceibacterota bacterium]